MENPGSNAGKLGFICRDLLRHLQYSFSVEYCDDVLKRCADKYGLTPPLVQLLRRIADDGGYRTETPSPESVGYVSADVVRDVLAEATEQLANMDHSTMFAKDYFDHYLYLWHEVADSKESPKRFLLDAVQNKDKLLMLIRGYLERSGASYNDSLYSQLDYGYGTGLRIQLFESFGLIRETFNNVNMGYLVNETLDREEDRQAVEQLRSYLAAEKSRIEDLEQQRLAAERAGQSKDQG